MKKSKEKYTGWDRQFATKIARKTIAVDELGGKCNMCGEDNIIVLEFHHLGNKSKNISTMFSSNVDDLKKEILKCELLCGNCHSTLQHNNSAVNINKIKLLQIKGDNKCSVCGNANGLCLCFHHRDPSSKKFQPNAMHVCKEGAIRGRHGQFSKTDIKKELNKCDVLCRNCHLIHHFNTKRYNKVKNLIDYKLLVYRQIELNKIKDIEINNKHSSFRKQLSRFLVVWRREKCVKKTSDIFGINYFQLRIDLLYSKMFVKMIARGDRILNGMNDMNQTALILLTQGKASIVDKEDYNWLLKNKWCAHGKQGEFYAVRTVGKKNTKGRKYDTICMSRAILENHNGQIDSGFVVIHLNKNKLDNRKSNLVAVTVSECRRHGRLKVHQDCTKYKWICWDPYRNKWASSIKIGNKYINLGRFDNENIAAYISDRKYINNFDLLNCTNFVYTKGEIEQERCAEIPFYLLPKSKINYEQ